MKRGYEEGGDRREEDRIQKVELLIF